MRAITVELVLQWRFSWKVEEVMWQGQKWSWCRRIMDYDAIFVSCRNWYIFARDAMQCDSTILKLNCQQLLEDFLQLCFSW